MNGNCIGPLFLFVIMFIIALVAVTVLKSLGGASPTRSQIIKSAFDYDENYGRDTAAQFEVLDETHLGKDDYIIGWKQNEEGVRDIPVIVHGTASDRWEAERKANEK